MRFLEWAIAYYINLLGPLSKAERDSDGHPIHGDNSGGKYRHVIGSAIKPEIILVIDSSQSHVPN